MTIYFVRLEHDGPIKIGFTAGTVRHRLKQLQTGQPGKLYLLGTIPGDRGAEIGLHENYAQYRINGEWFSPSADLLEAIHYLVKHQAPWYFCRDKAPIISTLEDKIRVLEEENKALHQRLNQRTDHWIRKRLSDMAARVRKEKERADKAEQRLATIENKQLEQPVTLKIVS